MRKRIKHNDLLPWFTDDHRTLPASYVKSCQEFFNWLDQCNQNGFQAPSSKPQASYVKSCQEFFDSIKQQAPSSKPQASSNKLDNIGFYGKSK
jgi:hypothetical protein